MLRRLFKGRVRDLSDPQEALWVKYFTTQNNIREFQLAVFPGLSPLITAIPDTIFDPETVNDNLDIPNDVYLMDLFRLRQTPPFQTLPLVKFVHGCVSQINQNEKVSNVVYPLIFRFAIKYILYWVPSFNDCLNNPDIQIDFSICVLLLEIMRNIHIQFQEDATLLIQPLYNAASEALSRQLPGLFNPPILEFLSDLVCLSIRTSSNNSLITVGFLIDYYSFWADKTNESRFGTKQIEDCCLLISTMSKLDVNFVKTHRRDILTTFLQAGFIFLGSVHRATEHFHDFFRIGYLFVEFLNFVISLGEDFSQLIWEHSMLKSTVYFCAWTIDRFPLVEFTEVSQRDEVELSYFKRPLIDPPDVQFQFI
jgi:hypothetical protein